VLCEKIQKYHVLQSFLKDRFAEYFENIERNHKQPEISVVPAVWKFPGTKVTGNEISSQRKFCIWSIRSW